MSSLTPQEKLSLALTGAVSVRSLARDMGVTHQKLGRWLREGQFKGIKKIPTDFFTQSAIGYVFGEYRDKARAQAAIVGVPFSETVPVYYHRRFLTKPDKAGFPILGDRVIVEHSQFITTELRSDIIKAAVKSKGYISISVRSTVDMIDYAKRIIKEEIANGLRSKRDIKAAVREFAANLARKQEFELSAIEPRAVYTAGENAGLNARPSEVVRGIEWKLNLKHSSAVGKKGTSLADSYVMQLLPSEKSNDKPAQARAKKSNIRGRGGK